MPTIAEEELNTLILVGTVENAAMMHAWAYALSNLLSCTHFVNNIDRREWGGLGQVGT